MIDLLFTFPLIGQIDINASLSLAGRRLRLRPDLHQLPVADETVICPSFELISYLPIFYGVE